MDILYLLIPISMIFVVIIAWVFVWSVKSGQYEDMEGPAHKILMDNDSIQATKHDDDESPDEQNSIKSGNTEENQGN